MLFFVIHENIVPNKLELVQNLLDKFILSFVILPPDVIDIGRFFNDVFVVLPSESFMRDRFAKNVRLFIRQESLDYFDKLFIVISRNGSQDGNHRGKHFDDL